VNARRLQTGLVKLIGHIRCGFCKAFRTGAAAFQFIVGQISDVRPPRFAARVPILSGVGNASKQKHSDEEADDKFQRGLL